MSPRIPAFVAGLAAAFTLGAPAALAHAHLTTSTPAADAVVAAPKTVSLTFSETLEPKFSGLTLTGPGGGGVPLRVTPSEDRRTLVAAPAKPLGPGAYKAVWHAVAKDGHRMEGAYSFTVR